MKYPENILETTCWPYMQYLNTYINQYLIMASHNTKVKKFSSNVIPLFGLPYSYWGYVLLSWVY
jgi:hypothetical protein